MLKYLILILPLLTYGDTLKSLLEFSKQQSDLVISKAYYKEAKNKQVDAKKSAYYPTIDIGAFYQTLDERTLLLAGDIYSGYAKLSFDIYDGGKKSALLSQSKNELLASEYDLESTKKNLSLKITQDFFTIKSLESILKAKKEANVSLKEQLTRMERFLSAKLATSDDVDRLQAAYDTNIYNIESLKLQILTLKKSLELKVAKKIDRLEDSSFKKFIQEEFELTDSVKLLVAQKDAVVASGESIDSALYPQVKLENTYSIFGYKNTDALHPKGVDNQNKFLISLNMRLFDMGTISKSKQVIMINSQALNSQIAYIKKEQKMQHDLAIIRIKTSDVKIKSALSALKSAKSAFKTITKKYNAGIVDNIVYLDALTSLTDASALYESSLNDLEIAYAIYYYYAGKNIEEFIK